MLKQQGRLKTNWQVSSKQIFRKNKIEKQEKSWQKYVSFYMNFSNKLQLEEVPLPVKPNRQLVSRSEVCAQASWPYLLP